MNGYASQQLTIQQLADFDDVATALIVDSWLEGQTHKMRQFVPNKKNWKPTRELLMQYRSMHCSQEITLDRLLQYIPSIPEYRHGEMDEALRQNCEPKDPQRLTEEYLETERQALRTRFQAFTCHTQKSLQLMKAHLRKFLDVMDMSKSGIEIAPCNRYSNDKKYQCGAKVIALREFQRGEVLKYLPGVVAAEKRGAQRVIIPGVNDFSVTISTRTKEHQLWLGPAAYINHDCNPNTRLRATGTTKHSSAVYDILRKVESGEELSINYGNNFFGINNSHCECRTCEMRQRGFFNPRRRHGSASSSELRTTPSRKSELGSPDSEFYIGLSPSLQLSPGFSVSIGGYPLRQNSRPERKN